MTSNIVNAISHPNIALIKYWGKKDIDLNIPTNTSLSITLPKLRTETQICYSNSNQYYFILDEVITKFTYKMERIVEIFQNKKNIYTPITIKSTNNFPHSCGLASSASGFSALVKALNIFYDTKFDDVTLSGIARMGSGSACRSIGKGIVKWENENAVVIGEWEELRVFNIVTEDMAKKVGSTEGMIRTIKTSNLFKYRLEMIDEKVRRAEKYIADKNFEGLGKLVMQESNEIHAICLDTYPPIFYLNEHSKNIIEEVFRINDDSFEVFYSFDAGPNPFIFVLKDCYDRILRHFKEKFNFKIIEAR